MHVSQTKIEKLSEYIEAYWARILVEDTRETKSSLGLPHPYFVPSNEIVDGFSFPHMFYWDSYFIAQGLWGTKYEHMILGITENMFDMVRRFGFVPNSNSFSHLSRSQPPYLSSLVMQIHESIPQNKEWLELAYTRVKEELETVWLGTEQPHNRMVHRGLSRFYDTNVLHVLAEAESGWDYTTRFEDHCMDYLPVDLNALLYKYEVDLAQLAAELGKHDDVDHWNTLAAQRKANMNDLMWSERDGLYFDYDYRTGGLGRVESLASYVPLFVGMCSDEQAAILVQNLELFETEHGLTTTAKKNSPPADKQWATPNGWAPLHDMVVDGLIRYGYIAEAKRISQKWVNTVADGLEATGQIDEKYNVLDSSAPAGNAVYPDQHGFGWTNGVTAKFIDFLA